MQFKPFEEVDRSGVVDLFARTFADSEGESEGAVIGRIVCELMNDADSGEVLGFVAVEGSEVIGGIFFSRLWFETPVEAFLLSPVAVRTDHQGRGVGQALIGLGLDRLRRKGVTRVFTYGDPGYYSRVGFAPISQDRAKPPFDLTQPEGWLCQSLDGGEVGSLVGRARCVKAFNDPGYW